MQLVHVKVDETDLLEFDTTLDSLKQMNIINKDETRSSMIQQFIKNFPKANKDQLRQVKNDE